LPKRSAVLGFLLGVFTTVVAVLYLAGHAQPPKVLPYVVYEEGQPSWKNKYAGMTVDQLMVAIKRLEDENASIRDENYRIRNR